MNIIDLIVLAVLIFAVWRGWHQGCIVQLCSLVGLFIAVWFASRFGTAVGELCGFDAEMVGPGGFLIVFVVALCAAAVAGRLLRKVLHFAGLGMADVILGIGVAVVKYLLLLSLLTATFDRLNADYAFVDRPKIEGSKSYRPLLEIADRIFPYVDQLRTEAAEHLSTRSGAPSKSE